MTEVIPQVTVTNAPTSDISPAGASTDRPSGASPGPAKAGDPSFDGAPAAIASNWSERKLSKDASDSNIPSMTTKPYTDDQDGSGAAIDPLSRQILKRTNTQHKIPQSLYANNAAEAASGPSEEASVGPAGRTTSDAGIIQRIDSGTSSKLGKDKKKGVSFLSRFMGSKKKEDSVDFADNASELSETRPTGMEAEVFTQPVGFIPHFPAPPKYIKVKAQNRKTKEFDRVFLAQVLLESEPATKSRKPSDARIVSIDAPAPGTAPAPTGSKAIWAMEFSKDGKYLAAGGQDKKLRVWQVISTSEDREADESLSGPENNEDGSTKLNAPVFKTKLVREYDGHTSSILDLSWSKNNFLLSSSMDKTVRLYHISRTECLCAFKHTDFVTSIQFHPRDDRFFLAGSLDSKLRLWSIPDKSVAYWAHVPDMVTAVAFTPDGKTSIAGCLNGVCIIYDTEGLKAHSQIHVRSARGRNAKGSKITGIDAIMMPRNNSIGDVKLLITSNDSRVRLYNLRDRSLEIKFRGNENTCSQIRATFSDDGKYVLCGSEDRKVYIWPTDPMLDSEKRPVEIFEAHSTIVTTAILAPTKTRQLLAQSGDPVYDLCNPPPVVLRSRSESLMSSRAPTDNGSAKETEQSSTGPKIDSPKRAQDNPTYLSRHAHSGGNIIVTADYTGQIKIFRQDCAYKKRRQETWEKESAFSKKIAGRSGSITGRTSVSSFGNHRASLSLGANKNPSADRILNWRNSIATNESGGSGHTSVSDINLRPERARSASPKKSFSFSKHSNRHSSILANAPAAPSSPSQPLDKGLDESSRPSTSDARLSGSVKPPYNNPSQASPAVNSPRQNDPAQPQGDDGEASTTGASNYRPVPVHQPDDNLWLQGDQSYMYWNVRNNLAPMVVRDPRTPGDFLNADGSTGNNPLSRRQSVVSQLSSEQVSSIGSSAEEEEKEAGKRVEQAGNNTTAGRNVRGRTASPGDGDDLKCHKCGNETFKASIGTDGIQRLRCKRCGTAI